MRILLIEPQTNQPIIVRQSPSRALLILGTLAKKHGNAVLVHHQKDETETKALIADSNPDLIGLTVNTFQVKHAKDIVYFIRHEYPKVKLVIGGPHAPAWDGEADNIIIGEGENDWLELIGQPPYIEEPDDIPIPDYTLVEMDKFMGIEPVGAVPSYSMMASRGCPFHCIFCNTPVYWGKKVRRHSPARVLEEVKLLHDCYGAKEIFFQDDTFNLDHQWAGEIFRRIIAAGLNKSMIFRICCRVNENLITKDFLDLARKAGVWSIFYGVESGSQTMLDRMRKGQTVREIMRAFHYTREAGIQSQASFVIGLPGETKETLAETMNLLAVIQPNKYGFCPACPFPKTELDHIVTEKGHKLPLKYEEYGYGKIICRTDELDYDDIAQLFRKEAAIAL